MCEKMMPDYTDIVHTGRWFHPLRESMDAFFARTTRHVTGEVDIKFYRGHATAVATRSPFTLYSEDLATFGESADFDQADSRGFVKPYGLPGMVAASVQQQN